MITNPTNERREQAREIVAVWKRDIGQVVKYERMEADIASALSSRDTEIREALEGISKVLTFETGPPQRCWCDAWVHTDACLAARNLYAKLQPREASDGIG